MIDPKKPTLVLDLETNNLDGDIIWCVGFCDEEGRTWVIIPKALSQELLDEHTLIFHNAAFDVKVLRKHGFYIEPGSYYDTMVMSYVDEPGRDGGHSLAAWGQRLGYPKGEHSDWSQFSQKMADYCQRDVELTRKLWRLMMDKFAVDGKASNLLYQVELPFIEAIMEMESTGFYFDRENAESLLAQWSATRQQLQHDNLANILVPGKEKIYARGQHTRNNVTTGSHCVLDEFNPNSSRHKQWLLYDKHKLKPPKYTESGQPSTDDETLALLAEQLPVAKVLSDISTYTKHISMVQGYIDRLEGRKLFGSFNQCVTLTGRLSSTNPNLQNIPTRGEIGKEIRKLFIAPEDTDYVIVGCDLSNIEGRVLAHYLSKVEGDTRMADTFKAGIDFHQANADAWQVTRNEAKTLLYACVPMFTEALTRTGWKTYDQLTVGEDVLAYDPDTQTNRWTPIEALHYKEEDDVIEWECSSTKRFYSTPDHRWIGGRRSGSRKGRYYIEEEFTTSQLTSEHYFINTAVAEGGEGCSVFGIVDKHRQDSHWEKMVLAMSTSERWLFFSANIATDGYNITKPGHRAAYGFTQDTTKQPGLYNAMLLCGYLLGFQVTRGTGSGTCETLRFSPRQHTTGQKVTATNVGKQPVWCMTTKFGTWVMRQHNNITITGNCLYGAGDTKLGNGSKERGKELRDKLDKNMPALQRLKEKVWATCASRGYIYTAFGRRLVYKGMQSSDRGEVARAQRQVFNAMLQGTAADVLKIIVNNVMIDLDALGFNAHLIANVHDEALFYCHKREAGQFAAALTERFSTPLLSHCPIAGEAKIGLSWYDVH